MRQIAPLAFALLLSACGDWPDIDPPPGSGDKEAEYTPFNAPETFVAPVVDVDPDAPDPEALVTARAEALRARAARLRARDL